MSTPAPVPIGASPALERSHVFTALVEKHGDLVGLVAYGLYKQRKLQWVQAFIDREHREPKKDELLEHSFGYQDDALVALRSEAEGALFKFSETMLNENMPVLQSEAFNDRVIAEVAELKGKLKELSGYKHHIVGHIFGFFALVLVWFFFTNLWNKYEPHVASMFSSTPHAPAQTQTSPPAGH